MAQGQGHDATRFQYDDLNRVTLCEQTGHNDQPVFSRSNYNDYDLVNNLKSISREEDGNKGELFDYDDANQLRSVSYRVDVAPRAPEPEPGGGGSAVVAVVEKDVEREAVAALEADPGREPLVFLATEPEPDAAAAGPRTVTYVNDAINRLSMSDTATGQTTNYSPNHLNQYTAVTGQDTPGYDGKFNLSGYADWTYVYDAEKRLISAEAAGHSAQFVYDGVGRCVKRTIDGAATVFIYDGWKPIVEWTGGGVFVAWNLYGPGPDEILVRYQPNTGSYVHYHLDALGNVQFLLSGELNLGLEKYTYDVFGKPTITGWNGGTRPISLYGNRFLFTGREYLYTLGIYDYRHRYYHPGLGCFMQTDPLGLHIEGAKLSAQQTALFSAGTAPQTFSSSELNLYRYCHNNPVNFTDPMGLLPPGKDLMDVSRDTLRALWAEHIKNVHEALKPGNWQYLPGGRIVKPEFGTIVESKNGKEQPPRLLKGDKVGQDHQPVVEFTRHKGKEWKVNRITHVHTTMRAHHYDQDVPTAHRLRTISGVGSTFDNGASLELYVPREDGGRGGFFKTRDGRHLTDLNNQPVPH